MTERCDTPAQRLSDESVRMLRDLFAKHAENGATIFHQAHAEELLALAEEVIAIRSETAALAKDAARYRNIREHGIPCSQGDDCGSCTGEELDEQTDDAIAHPEKYDV